MKATAEQIKHTPGEWVQYAPVLPYPETKVGIRLNGGYICIADCSEQTTGNGNNNEANAKLITTAPEMLDCLQKIMAHIDNGNLVRNIENDHRSDFAIKALPLIMDLKSALSVIKKATE